MYVMVYAMAWDATTYDELPLPHGAWGAWAVEQLEVQGDEHVLDVGCGTGRDLDVVLERHPGIRATALDPSPTMLERATERLGRHGDRVRLVRGDVTEPIDLDAPADAAMSVAAMHWVLDHDAAFARLHEALAPGARLVIDCGGHGNIARTRAAIDAAGLSGDKYVHFADDVTTRARLERAGFEVDEAALLADDHVLPDVETLESYLATVIMSNHLAGLDDDEAREIVARTAQLLPDRTVDYVRLRVVARRV